jgi:hypothetical protein
MDPLVYRTAKGRAVPLHEVIGRAHELASLDGVLVICRRLEWVQPVLDFAYMHATSWRHHRRRRFRIGTRPSGRGPCA